MKNFKIFLLAIAGLLAFSACSDKDSASSEGPQEDGPDYLVMLYAVGGGNLDSFILSNIYQALDAGSCDNVKMTVQYKASKNFQVEFPEFDGTRRFDLDDNTHLVGTIEDALSYSPIIRKEVEIRNLFSQLKSERFADADYRMASSEGLTEFIKWSKAKHPGAKRTILIINDHGGGWRLETDGLMDSRAILWDDIEQEELSLNQVVEGVKNAGKVDVLYTDACLMSVYENLYGYADCARYLLASIEFTPGGGGEYGELLTALKWAEPSNAEVESSMLQLYLDYLASDRWWQSNKLMNIGLGNNYADIGLYDLSKIDRLTAVLKKTTDTMVEKFDSDESINPTAELCPLGDTFHGYINYALSNCMVADCRSQYSVMDVPSVLIPYLEKDKFLPSGYTSNWLINTSALIVWLRYAPTDNAKEACANYPDEWEKMKRKVVDMGQPCYSITDMLRLLDEQLTAVGAANNPFKPLRAELLATLKDMAYISCTIGDEKPGIDQAYELCSPGVTLVPFNDYYNDNFSNNFKKIIPTYQQAQSIYQSTKFDQQVGWSRMLQRIEIFPNALTNPSRRTVAR